jgi:HEAT repeat protein
MNLFFCPKCRKVFPTAQLCPDDNILSNDTAKGYVEKLLETVLSKETSRAGMAVDVLTKWLHEPRALVPLTMLLERKDDAYSLVLGARGLGWLKNTTAVPALERLILNEEQPYVARVEAATALGQIGGRESAYALEQAQNSPRSSVADASAQALEKINEMKQDNQT